MSTVLILIFSAMLSLAESSNIELKRSIGVFDDLNNRVDYVYCDPSNPNSPAYCKNLHGYVCSVNKKSNLLGALNTETTQSFWSRLPKPATSAQFNEMAKSAISNSESNVYKVTQVERDEIRNLLSEAKSVMKTFITSTPYLPRDKVREMHDKVNNVNLKYGTEYVAELVAYAKRQGSTLPNTEIEKQAFTLYMSACGVNGLEVNAFYESGSIILCPGLVISLKDYGANKQEILNALSFTFGHELGHAVDAGEYPGAYSKMQSCYETLSSNPNIWQDDSASEISADYWGGIVLSNRLKNVGHADAARTIAFAMDGLCDGSSQSGHSEASFRINQSIAKHQLISEVMGCQPATKEAPFCSLRGTYPVR
jgi:hypothetical protein